VTVGTRYDSMLSIQSASIVVGSSILILNNTGGTTQLGQWTTSHGNHYLITKNAQNEKRDHNDLPDSGDRRHKIMKPKQSIHQYPQGYSHLERACAMMNMMIDRGKLHESWKVEVPIMSDTFAPVVFDISQAHTRECHFLEGYMLGMAIASGTITIGKCREWLRVADMRGAHELANFGGAIRDKFSIDEDDTQ